tara:strand:- start:46717 stop:47277 length:561 start_codon:yes stop_codon:yes gene_type:complete
MSSLGQASAILYGTTAPGNTNVLWAKTTTNDPNTWAILGFYQYLSGAWSLITVSERSTTAPSDTNKVWLDSNFTPPVIKTYNGSAWAEINKLRSVTKTEDFTLSANENNAFVNINSANDVTVTLEDPGLTEFACTLSRLGTGAVTIVPAGAVLINGVNGALSIQNQWRSVMVRKLAEDEFLVEGNI